MTTRAAKRKAAARVVRDPGPFRGMPGTKWEGMTNAECLAGIREMLGGPMIRGNLYRLIFGQGYEGRPVGMIVEYVGLDAEHWTNGAVEPALRFIIRNPVLPAPAPGAKPDDAKYPEAEASHRGTPADPIALWPLDVHYIAPAEPGDLDKPMGYRVAGEPDTHRPFPGTPVQ